MANKMPADVNGHRSFGTLLAENPPVQELGIHPGVGTMQFSFLLDH